MKPLVQAIQVARKLLASGHTGSALADGLRPVVSTLSEPEKKILASRISKEYYILGHAAHDPNMYKTCQAAKIAKDKSENPHLKLLTYKTPMCGSCALNRQGSCHLMGGRLIDGPMDIPERAVQKTADLLISEQSLGELDPRTISMNRSSAHERMASLHEKRIQVQAGGDHSGDQQDQARSRVAAAILDPAESRNIRARTLTGPARKRNAEVLGLGGIGGQDDRRIVQGASRVASMMGDELQVEIPMDRPRRRLGGVQLEATPEMTVPDFGDENPRHQDLHEDQALEAQQQLHKLSKHASLLLGQGQMTTRAASKIYHHMSDLMGMGAVPNPRISAIQRQLNSLGGGLEL